MPDRISAQQPRPVRWIGSSKDDLSGFPKEVRLRVGGALWEAQIGARRPTRSHCEDLAALVCWKLWTTSMATLSAPSTRSASPRRSKAVYVLHAFQKKSKRGIATPKSELDLIDRRLRRAREDYEQWSKSENREFR